ncbi:MAG: ftsY, partial [Acidimicrobiales bacterium]|nr:ftsY [Acidimicrobiales bacterium]
MELVILVVAVLVVIGTVVGLVAGRRGPDRGALLEPPPVPRISSTPPAPPLSNDDNELDEPSSAVGTLLPPGEAPPEEHVGAGLEVPEPDSETVAEIEEALATAVEVEQREAVKPRFRDRLSRARGALAGHLGNILSRGGIDAETWDELEEALIRADVGV